VILKSFSNTIYKFIRRGKSFRNSNYLKISAQIWADNYDKQTQGQPIKRLREKKITKT
jgi:hypothetical protein